MAAAATTTTNPAPTAMATPICDPLTDELEDDMASYSRLAIPTRLDVLTTPAADSTMAKTLDFDHTTAAGSRPRVGAHATWCESGIDDTG
jgi:hypothetical protein